MKPAAMPLTARSRRGQVERSNIPCAFARVTTLSSVLKTQAIRDTQASSRIASLRASRSLAVRWSFSGSALLTGGYVQHVAARCKSEAKCDDRSSDNRGFDNAVWRQRMKQELSEQSCGIRGAHQTGKGVAGIVGLRNGKVGGVSQHTQNQEQQASQRQQGVGVLG